MNMVPLVQWCWKKCTCLPDLPAKRKFPTIRIVSLSQASNSKAGSTNTSFTA